MYYPAISSKNLLDPIHALPIPRYSPVQHSSCASETKDQHKSLCCVRKVSVESPVVPSPRAKGQSMDSCIAQSQGES